MHGSLFDASSFNHVIIKEDYVGVRYILVGVVNGGPVLWWVLFHCVSPVTVESKRNMLCPTVCSWTWSVWPRHASMGLNYAQSKTLLHIFEPGNVSFERYCREAILDYVRLLTGMINLECMFMDDNERPHRNTEASKHSRKERYQLYAITCALPGPKSYWACLWCTLQTNLALFEPCNSWKLPWERSKTIFPHGFPDSLIGSMNNQYKMYISIWRNHSSYSGTHICCILARIPIFVVEWKCSRRHLLYFWLS